ncbi:hypothetical protein ZHAS_00012483 [Anopheles sinensis]|uniref:Uncharacterized protein n=1 Tax=Anopheles sinensis TaxID=74873 RepID=A0A084W307_ANOSI|nr:hypothetical protein ZHAS_00012483 [Anopheles sinensis]
MELTDDFTTTAASAAVEVWPLHGGMGNRFGLATTTTRGGPENYPSTVPPVWETIAIISTSLMPPRVGQPCWRSETLK